MKNSILETTSKEFYLDNLLNQFQINNIDNFKSLKQDSLEQIRKLSFPTSQDEEWRFIDLRELYKHQFKIAKATKVTKKSIEDLIIPEVKANCIVFVDGLYDESLSSITLSPNDIFIGTLKNLPDIKKDEVYTLLNNNLNKKDIFSRLNTIGLIDPAVIIVSENTTIKEPVQLLFISTQQSNSSLVQPHTLLVAEKGANVSFIECYSTIENSHLNQDQINPYFTNSVTEIFLKDNARVTHNRIQLESNISFHIGKSNVTQDKDSFYALNQIDLGSRVCCNNIQIFQNGSRTESCLNGLSILNDDQISCTKTSINLNHPNGMIDQLHKYVVDDKAHGIFDGKIIVSKLAQITNAKQLNRNLLLSKKSRINTKPELQITADNVKCSHGATISQLESNELFYLQSRGLSEANARHLLVNAFIREIIMKIPYKSLEQKLIKYIVSHTKQY
ncbi:MAG: Iron-regulated ABC transporter permease protein SufD [Candidatus Atelocyanobacterium thalassa isolate SIO64986]|uniref:Iron-regulated ABC transporter permease protein SufD n=1 Tax=Candidatus Atelocyanobacterium thalassa isolate SIO64986 TaxID=1527444 RepID=A0A086CH15_9CHRO|nr:MAG: Iron-regulated ABC transporter permease protein SufD [Candidatus Atelocyanobacterium thalassa isolate SIO64986]